MYVHKRIYIHTITLDESHSKLMATKSSVTHLMGSISIPLSLVKNLKKNKDLSSLPVIIKFFKGSITNKETFMVCGLTALINRNLFFKETKL